MEALGLTVYSIPTIVLSHHPGHDARPAGLRLPAAELAAMINSLMDLGVLDRLSAMLTGYFAGDDQIFAISPLLRQLKQKNPSLLYLCDPVIGAETLGLYVPIPVAEAVRSTLIPLADIITPNCFELEWLAGQPVRSVDDLAAAHLKLHAKSIIAKSMPRGDLLLTVLAGPLGSRLIESRRRDGVPHGTGDLLSGLFLGHLLKGLDAPSALERSIAILDTVIEASTGSTSLDLSVLRKLSEP
jgi:pyridoxine kinase